VRIADALDEQTAYDLVVVTTLSHQVDTILPALERSQAKCFHFMFVNFNPERLTTALGKQRCSFGMPFVMANLDGQGRLIPTTVAPWPRISTRALLPKERANERPR
jgi:2-dehydropantoate 2-reductase